MGHCDASPERISQIHDELLEALAYTGGCELDLIPRSVGEAVRILFFKNTYAASCHPLRLPIRQAR